MSKPGTPKKAPKIAIPSKKKPNFMRENLQSDSRKSPQAPMKKKRLSK